jgi:glycosyltransferase involved in cell wall biosynthesis
MRPLRIGINALYLIPGGVGGTEIYLRSLLRALARVDKSNRYIVFTNRETGPDLAPVQPNFSLAPQAVCSLNRPARLLWEQTLLPLAAWRLGIDVLFNPGFTAPVLCPCPSLTVFHDLQHKRHPEFFRWYDLPFWRAFLCASAHSSRALIADSEATRKDLLHYYRLPQERVRTIPLGVDSVFFDLKRSGLEDYILCVSTLHPHKNLEGLIRAFAGFHRHRPTYRLVLAGMRGFHAEELENLIRSLDLADWVHLTGWISRDELYKWYAHAAAFVYPSEFEGFGMPVLEAMAAGIPTACSAIEPLAGITGGAALQFDPNDETAILDAMERLVGDEATRQRLSVEGPLRAAQFSWQKAAEATLAAIRSVAKAPSQAAG